MNEVLESKNDIAKEIATINKKNVVIIAKIAKENTTNKTDHTKQIS